MYEIVASSYKIHLNSFYESINGANLKDINKERLNELKELSKKYINSLTKNTPKSFKYIKLVEKIKHRSIMNISNFKGENMILFIFTIDPTFETIKIYDECNHINEIKERMIEYFGIYDKNLIVIERAFIKQFFSKEEKKNLDEEIKKRVFK